jgi:predicted permease
MKISEILLKDKLELVLRIGVFGVFLGHGVFALEGKQTFVEMIQSMVPVDAAAATSLLFAVGVVDILVAFSVLLKPQKVVLIYATIWAFMTALARITAGDPVWDFVERAANWTVPLALLLYIQLKSKVREKEVPRVV